jgi:lipoprotein-anchoring transpeptidase ErfK/SrfK
MQLARIAIRKGDLAEARRLLRQVVRDDPQNHAAWLLLAKVTPSPEAAAEYVKRAESLRPDSQLVQRARMGIEREESGQVRRRDNWRRPTTMLISGLALLFALVAVWAGAWAWEQVSPLKSGMAAEVSTAPTLVPTVDMTPESESLPVATPVLLPTPTIRPTFPATPTAMATVGEDADEEEDVSDTAEPVETPDTVEIEEEPVPDDPTGLRPPGVRPDERWIDVNLSTQSLVAYEGNTPVYNSLISSGTQEFPTVTGQYRTYIKYETQDMDGYLLGYDYFIENVPYVMYFFDDYAIHGAYWHNNFGVPMSHGCVNVDPVDAGWLFNWAPVGTTVNIHH